MNFHLSPYNHHQTEFITQPLISMSNPDDLNSIFKDPSDIKMEDLSKPKQTLQLKQSLCMITQVNSINHSTWAVPHYGTPCCSSAYPNDNPIISIILTEPLFLPWQWPQWPFPLGEDIIVVGRGTQFVKVEARDCNHYWITFQVDDMGVEFTTQVDWHIVIGPNPQDVLSQLDWVGSFIWLWWGHLSELVHQS